MTRTQQLPGWAEPPDTINPAAITPEVILRAGGRTDNEIETTALHAAEALLVRTLASGDD